jgi:alanyl-tRNA synthetase
LERGLKLLDEETAKMQPARSSTARSRSSSTTPFGFPLDLTADVLRGQKREVNMPEFDAAMERQRATARAAWAGSGEAATETIWFDLKQKVGASEFLGYETESAQGIVTALVQGGKEVESAKASEEVAIVTNQTPFYGESGGQMGDTGKIVTADGAVVEVHDVQKKLGELFVHLGKVVSGSVKKGDAVELKVDGKRRSGLRAHHSGDPSAA